MPPKVAQMIKEQEEQKIFKELEELGYEIKDNCWTLVLNKPTYSIVVNKLNKSYFKVDNFHMAIHFTFQEHQLLHRLFEIWGWLE